MLQKYIALFRGINVGGKNKLPMAGLKIQLQEFGFKNIITYIQSGNVIFEVQQTDEKILAEKITNLILKTHGFAPQIIVLTLKKLQQVAKNCPFEVDVKNGNLLHFFFLSQSPKNADIAGLNAIKLESETYKIIDDMFYFYAPSGFGRSKLAAKAEKLLGVSATARNFKTLTKLLEIAI